MTSEDIQVAYQTAKETMSLTEAQTIESLSPSAIQEIIALCDSLHKRTATDKTLPTSDHIEEAMLSRRMLKLKLDEARHYLSSEMEKLESMKRLLGIHKGYVVSDWTELNDQKFNLLIQEKELRNSMPHP